MFSKLLNVKEILQALAEVNLPEDDEDFIPVDYVGDNTDDAYAMGARAGKTLLARELLEYINEKE